MHATDHQPESDEHSFHTFCRSRDITMTILERHPDGRCRVRLRRPAGEQLGLFGPAPDRVLLVDWILEHGRQPTAGEVLASMLADAESWANSSSFEGWCAAQDIGTGGDAREIYDSCCDASVRLAGFLGVDYGSFVEVSRGL